jgi:alpha-L-fucosidase
MLVLSSMQPDAARWKKGRSKPDRVLRQTPDNGNELEVIEMAPSPFGKLEWGRCTKKEFARGTTLYLHVFDWPEDGRLVVPGLKNKVQQAYLMADWKALETRNEESGVVVSLPAQAPDEIDSVLVLKVSGALDVEIALPMPKKDGALILSAESAYLHNNEGSRDVRVQGGGGDANLGYWTDAEAWVEWSFKIDKPGKYEVLAELALQEEKTRFRLVLPGQQKTVELASTGGYGNYRNKSLGKLRFDKAGEYTLQIRPDKDAWQPINLRQLELKLQ